MARVVYTRTTLRDLRRLADFLLDQAPDAAPDTVGLIEEAVGVLGRHPFIGREVEHGLRELVISRGKTGYLALYSHEAVEDAVLVLALRHQREVGYGAG